MELKKLQKSDKEQFRTLNETIRNNLANSAFFIPLGDFVFENFYKPDMFITYGFFDGEKLAACSLLSLDEDDLSELKELLKLDGKTAELGASMTLPDYRGNNLMLKINQKLLSEAAPAGLKYIVATAHPDNVASNSSLKKLGMEKVAEINRHGTYKRNVYLYTVK